MSIVAPGRMRLQYPSTSLAAPAYDFGSITLRASAALSNSTSSTNGSSQSNYIGAQGLVLYSDITVAGTSGTGALTIRMQEYAELGDVWIDSTGAAFAATTAVGQRTLYLYPGIAETVNTEVSRPVAPIWRIQADVSSSAGSFTFSVGARYLR